MKALMPKYGRAVGVVESVELVDSLYGITKEEREVLDAMHSLQASEPNETEEEWVLE